LKYSELSAEAAYRVKKFLPVSNDIAAESFLNVGDQHQMRIVGLSRRRRGNHAARK
jgi:hypothetical protein